MLLSCIVVLDFGRKRLIRQFGCVLCKFCFFYRECGQSGASWGVFYVP